ncbi:glycoside hydrolase family 16 protein [Gracilibacillus thailandensis]|uniref:licheninase n=1 Tax=Gracilibacillus thailandensis TaxID=563735 RepID=A0A6N7QZN5_9BACI|nr:glycoside hydrolase family 16 protein [Gracilibacillus thailandensis]MRI67613.1 family 16 glycosylhydrolase [Gracilibacillus thailandensis]
MNKFTIYIFVLLLIILPGLPTANHYSQVEATKASVYDYRLNTHKSNQIDSFTKQLSIKNKYIEDGWSLVWQDEFNQKQLDPDLWNIENWAAQKNNELQFYTPDNIKVSDGKLQLISKKQRYKGRSYTSAAIHSKDKFYFQYGKVEMRAKLPSGQGIFPAFWMMPNIDNTWLPEIDIMEMLGHKPNEIWMVQHWLNEDQQLKSNADHFVGDDYSQDYHTFSIEWKPGSITWLIDDKERFQSTQSIPQEDMYLYLNTAIGGDWPGSPDDTTVFPQVFEVDYIRVYQQKGANQ